MKKILIVDDDQEILEVVKFILMSCGFDVHTHTTGLHVPEVVSHYQPNLILLDILLPGKLGTDICKELKQINTAIPIILFSAHTDKTNALTTSGADGFIQKPFDLSDFVKTIKLRMN